VSFNRNHLLAIILTTLMLAPSIALISTSAQLGDSEQPIEVLDDSLSSPSVSIFMEGLPALYCNESTICPTTERSPSVPNDATVTEEPGWWLRYYPDHDSNGFDDRLQYILAGEFPSESPSAIIGADGELTVAINVDYAWNPRVQEVDQLMAVLDEHGWIGEEGGAKFFHHHWVDSFALDKVPQSALLDIYHLPGVVMLEQQNVLALTLAVATPAIKATSSIDYTTSAHMLGYRGDEVVIAVIDSGVDNEHRSLNDFDDVNDDPDSDASTYSDGKYLGGYDATNAANNTDGTDDPDDTAGHGTHVAGIAMGTGGPNRVNIGVAPGAYLVDVRAFQDIGNANAQDTQDAISWVIDNRNTNWGNNASSNGIDIMSMSFGRIRSLIGGADQGDTGTQTEARLVNVAFEQGIVPVCAMGNDGANYVSSPASADHCIAVAALDDMNTIKRDNDEVASYSNYGPRLDDDDGDSWDELKPDVIAPGSNIDAPRAQESSIGGVGGGQLADDDYVGKSGTSMSTPMVSGLCAIILQANPGFSPEDVKRALHDNSEFLPELSQQGSYRGNSWNASEGFGRVDAASSLQIRSGRWVNLTQPLNETWMDVGQTYRIRGSAEMLEEDVVVLNGTVSELSRVTISGRYTYWETVGGNDYFRNKTAFNWQNATGIDNWTYDLYPELWRDGAGLYIEVRAWDNVGRVSEASWGNFHLGETWMTLDEPSGFASLSGDVTLIGEYKAVKSDQVQYKVGSNGEWETAHSGLQWPYVCSLMNWGDDDCSSEEWSSTWDTTEYIDGGWMLYVRILSDSGESTTPIERYVYIDNVPASPELSPYGDFVVEDNGIVVDSAPVDSFLNVRAQLRNNGDRHARNVLVVLYENGDQIASETLSRVDSTDVAEVVFGYHPTDTGLSSLKIKIDPSDAIIESDESNNEQEISFTVDSIPVGVDLALREGAATTNPRVANPNGLVTLNLRLENLGSSDASGVTITLEKWSELGWDLLDTRGINIVSGAGYIDVPFTIHEGQLDVGAVLFRASVSVEGVVDLDPTNDELEFTLLADEAQLQGARKLELSEGHVPLGFFGYSGDNLLFTGEGDSIWVHRVNERYDLFTCLELEDDWGGEFAISSGEGDSANIVWTRRLLDQYGATVTTLSFSTVDLSCTNTEVMDLMPELMLAEGAYWGIDLEVEEGKALIGGYHRDLFTSGTYDDVTSIFMLDSSTPLDSESWQLTREVIPVIEPPVGMAGSVQVARGSDWTHMTYQAMRDDGTGSERVGTFYAHGRLGEANWSFKTALGDHTALGQLSVLQNSDGEDVVLTGWKEGAGYESELVLIRSDSALEDKEVKRVSAAGVSTLVFVETARGVQIFYESVGPSGRQLRYSMMDAESINIGAPLAEGVLVMVGRSESTGETHIIYSSPTMDWRARLLIDDRDPADSNRGIIDTIRIWTGLDARTFDLAWKIGVSVCAMGLILMLATSRGILSHRRRSKSLSVVIEEEDEDEFEVDVLDIDEDSIREFAEPAEPTPQPEEESASTEESGEEDADIEPSTDDEAVDEAEEHGRARRRSRRKRRSTREAEVEVEELPEPPSPSELADLPEPPSPGDLGLLPPPPGRDVTCECGATFRVKSVEMKSVKCPVCDAKISL
jgi:subtilisin family serine protease